MFMTYPKGVNTHGPFLHRGNEYQYSGREYRLPAVNVSVLLFTSAVT